MHIVPIELITLIFSYAFNKKKKWFILDIIFILQKKTPS